MAGFLALELHLAFVVSLFNKIVIMFSFDKFQTEVDIPQLESKLGYRRPFMMMGSCFATNIGQKLVRLKMPVMVNPFGVIYNPLSVAQSIHALAAPSHLEASDLFEQNGIWCSYSHHSAFSGPDRDDCLSKINQTIDVGAIMLRDSSHLIITLGTSWAYRLKDTGNTVANCHKTPSSAFDRVFVGCGQVVELLGTAIEAARRLNPSLKIVLTVSPIRHVKDGLVENQRSKSNLLVACHELAERVDGVSYFPSYEIMMDELRDYRFYAEDMVHPSAQAVDIIFKRFVLAAADEESQRVMADVEKVIRAVEHRPFNANTVEHFKFKAKMADVSERLQKRYSFLDLSSEISYFRQ